MAEVKAIIEKETKEIASQLDKILKRGPDDQRLISQNGRLFMFNRLAIMGLNESGMQPFTHNHNMCTTFYNMNIAYIFYWKNSIIISMNM